MRSLLRAPLLAALLAATAAVAPWEATCPRVQWRTSPAYPIWAQVHRTRLLGLSRAPGVVSHLRVLCIIGAVAVGGNYSASSLVADALLGDEETLPGAVARVRAAAVGAAPPAVVVYHNPRGTTQY